MRLWKEDENTYVFKWYWSQTIISPCALTKVHTWLATILKTSWETWHHSLHINRKKRKWKLFCKFIPFPYLILEDFELLLRIMLNDDYIRKGRFKIYNTQEKCVKMRKSTWNRSLKIGFFPPLIYYFKTIIFQAYVHHPKKYFFNIKSDEFAYRK